jgi:hypothetical protein
MTIHPPKYCSQESMSDLYLFIENKDITMILNGGKYTDEYYAQQILARKYEQQDLHKVDTKQ